MPRDTHFDGRNPATAVDAETDTVRGIALHIGAVAGFAVMASLIKLLGSDYPTTQVVFFRSFPALLPIWLYMRPRGGWHALRSCRPGVQAIRTGFGLVAMLLGFYCLARMPFADFVAISFAAPLFATILSVPILGERVGIRRATAVAVGFLGVLVTLQPAGGGLDGTALIALGATLFYAVAILAMRVLGATDSSGTTAFYFTCGGVLVGGIAVLGDWVMPRGADLAILIALGLVGGIAQILMTEAYRHAPPAVLAPFDYTALIWAIAFGAILFGDMPEPHVWLGTTIIAGSGLYIWYREQVLGTPRGRIKATSL